MDTDADRTLKQETEKVSVETSTQALEDGRVENVLDNDSASPNPSGSRTVQKKGGTGKSLFSSPKARAALHLEAVGRNEAEATKIPPTSFTFPALALMDIESNPFYRLSLFEEVGAQPGTRTGGAPERLKERLKEAFEQGELAEFIVPVRPHPENPDKYQLVYGHLRLEAARQAGITHIGAVIKNLSDEEMLKQLIQENQIRSQPSRLELAAQINFFRTKFGWSFRTLASFFNLPSTTIYELYYLSLAPADFLRFIEERPEYYQAVSEMARLGVPKAGQLIIWDYLQNESPTPRQFRNKIKAILG